MQCEVCKSAPASVHLTDVSNNQKKEIHLCENCARDKGATIKSYLNKDTNFPEFKTAQLMAAEFSESGGEDEGLVCPTCGLSYRKFRSTGKFGCPDDYNLFTKQVVQLLEKIHHKVQHTGKVPGRASSQMAVKKELNQLREELKNAIEREEYEKAAQIRDQIYTLEGRRDKRK
ncbi:MAG: type I-B CRISPR-associated protein Cas8b1/Cst1 [Planctomycetes bacterium]|nr:type I-B CRISPR-associated protein Cas8b1/Cst1 [Planctomycetota bacterium]